MGVKKILAIVLACCMMLALMPATAFASSEDCTCNTDGHKWPEEPSEVLKAPTCTEAGIYRYVCTCPLCSVYEDREVGALGHDYQLTEHKDPDCSNSGYDKYECSRCQDPKTTYINPTPHNYVFDHTVPPTCDEVGYDVQKCSACGHEYPFKNINTVSPLGHQDTYYNGSVTKEATCTESGITHYWCDNCGKSFDGNIDPLGHDFRGGVITQEPTEGAAGQATLNCSRCNATQEMEINAVPSEDSGLKILNASWGREGRPNTLGWDMATPQITDACMYKVMVVAWDNTFRLYGPTRYNDADAEDFVQEKGSGSYYYVVEAYDSEGNRIAYGRSDTVTFYKTKVTLMDAEEDGNPYVPVDDEDEPIDNEGGSIMYLSGSIGTKMYKSFEEYIAGGEKGIEPYPNTGYVVDGVTVNGTALESPYTFIQTSDVEIEVVFRKSTARVEVTVEAGEGHGDFVNALADWLFENDGDCEAVANGTAVTFHPLKAQTKANLVNTLTSAVYDLRGGYSGADAEEYPSFIGLKSTYEGIAEYYQDLMELSSQADPLPDELSLYVYWTKIVPKLDVSVVLPCVGNTVELVTDEETHMQTQNYGVRVTGVDPDVCEYKALMYKADDLSGENGMNSIFELQPFEGVVQADEEYVLLLYPASLKFGYIINGDTVFNVNGESASLGSVNIAASFTATEHDGGEEGIICSKCGKRLVSANPQFKSFSTVLSGQLGLNIYMDLSSLTQSEKEGSYVDFEVQGKHQKAYFDDNNRSKKNSDYHCFTCSINVLQMAEKITAVYHYTVNGEEKTKDIKCSVEDYINAFENAWKQNSGAFNEKEVALIHALKDYGYYSLEFLSKAKNWPEGEYARMEGPATPKSDFNITTIKALVNQHKVTLNPGDKIGSVTMTLSLDSNTVINLYLTPKEGVNNVSASMTYETASGTTTYNAKVTKASDGRYVMKIGNIPAHKLGTRYTVNISTNIGEAACEVSALSYPWLILNYMPDTWTEETKQAAQYAMAAICNYSKAADDYYPIWSKP